MMAKVEMPKLKTVGKVGHAHASHKPLDLDAARSRLKVLTTHRKGSAGQRKVRLHGGHDLRAELGLPPIRKGSVR